MKIKEDDIADVRTENAVRRDTTGEPGFRIEFRSCAR